ncbi:thiamine-monophosphate kinase [Thermotomaculum hydrothermale]|uniref:Thiamine-monophosphate kinase n=1 Tax=Thermotomaculum hydrothermale TaxID=981385 RepID=A0A7R6PYE4_9BACT|nr:thiamine-phosphate kinase [Thermotomaculum hydrothermale]BBB31888.1 thiamine-monophosphate kinase [Thermotomaculum hydrothermale]
MNNLEKEIISLLEKKHKFIGDDCAVFDDFVITTDSLVEHVHFDLNISTPYQVGVKTVCANLSDIAAMGAKPEYFLTSLSLPPACPFFIEGFLQGIEETLSRFNVELIGGDTTGSKTFVFINAVAIGKVINKPVFRSGAKVGDKIYLAGVPGYSAIGYYLIKNNIEIKDPNYAYAVKKHLEPLPQVEEGIIIGKNNLATAMIDISDGLSKEIGEICRLSGTGCILYSQLFKLPEIDLFEEKDLLNYFLHSGEEYILLFTSPLEEDEITEFLPEAYVIGEITDEREVLLEVGYSLVKLKDLTYNHFDNRKGLY